MSGIITNDIRKLSRFYIIIIIFCLIILFLFIQFEMAFTNFHFKQSIAVLHNLHSSYVSDSTETTYIPKRTSVRSKKGFVRAAIVYFPAENENTEQFDAELQWFERSWKEMKKYEPKDWRTDLVVFSIEITQIMEELNCTKITRKSRTEISRCIVIDNYVPVLNSYNLTFRPANSVNVAAVLKTTRGMEHYDWILRTDIDTFITPAFSTWKPEKMVVGIGAYEWGSDYITGHRLKRIADNLNLTFQNLTNIGSTWYGPLDLVAECAKLSMKIMLYLEKYEFTKLEKDPKFGIQGWPEWHYGVLTMYSGHLAINHCTVNSGIEKNDTVLDVGSASTDSIWLHPHIHTWHGRERFSKFAFFEGIYKNFNKSKIDFNNTIRDYATYIALDSVDNEKMVQKI